MTTISIIINVVVIWTVAVLSPGPNFFVAARTAVTVSRTIAIYTVAGVATGTLIWGISGFFGITLLFKTVPWLYLTLKIVGGAYLMVLGVRLIIHSCKPETTEPGPGKHPHNFISAYRTGLLTALSNPKAAAFTASLFAATMPADPPIRLGILSIAIMTTMSGAWYTVVAFLFSSDRITHWYHRCQRWIDRFSGLVFIGFGLKFATRQ